MQDRLMTHLVAGYPDMNGSFQAAKAMADAGAAYLEVQFPFSDPSADGPAIQKACSNALDAGFTLEKGFSQIRDIRNVTDKPVFIMSYANIPFVYGLDEFAKDAAAAGAQGLIIPDLVIGADEGLYEIAAARGLAVIPVIVPTILDERLDEILEKKPEYVYVAMRVGITGKKTSITEELVSFLEKLNSCSKLLAGFGIQDRFQVAELAAHAHALVVGSRLVRTITAASGQGPDVIYRAVLEKVRELSIA